MVASPRRSLPTIVVVLLLAMLVAPTAGTRAQSQGTVGTLPCNGVAFGAVQSGKTCLRLVNADDQTGNVDVYIGDQAVAQNLGYGKATDYVVIPSGDQRFRFVPAGGDVSKAPIDFTTQLHDDQAYQLTVTGLAAKGETPWLSGVAVSPLPPEQARVRVVNASPDTTPVDVSVVGGRTPFAGIAFGSQSGYVVFRPGTFRFQLRLSNADTVLVTTPEVPLDAGNNYDLYVIGHGGAGKLALAIFATKVGVATDLTPGAAPVITPIIAVGATSIPVTPGASPTPTT
jgi:hypothetical protein